MQRLMPEDEKERIRLEALQAMSTGEVYQSFATRLTRLPTPGAPTYRVEHGISGSRPPVTQDHKGHHAVQSAIATFLYYRQRVCTSCGQMGCPQDLVGMKNHIVEPLP